MEKKEAKVKQVIKAEVAKKVYSSSESVKFKSNGKSKHLEKGAVFTIDGEKANLFLKLGYGEVID
jgi:hypothetical protein